MNAAYFTFSMPDFQNNSSTLYNPKLIQMFELWKKIDSDIHENANIQHIFALYSNISILKYNKHVHIMCVFVCTIKLYEAIEYGFDYFQYQSPDNCFHQMQDFS